jgi:drug/metabolite transporter (DMT)-like permease
VKPGGLGRFYVVGFSALMAFDTLAQLSFKAAGMHALPLEPTPAWLLRVFGLPWIYGAFVGYLGAFFTWMTLLKHAPIGPAFAASHLEIVSVLLLSSWWFGEHIGRYQLLGSALIIAGIVCLAVSESEAAAPDGRARAAAGTSKSRGRVDSP